MWSEDHDNMHLEEVEILDREPRWCERGIDETSYICINQPSVNKDGGFNKLPNAYDPLLMSLQKQAVVGVLRGYAPDFEIPRGFSTLYRCLLPLRPKTNQTHEKPLNKGVVPYTNHRSLDQLLEFRTGFFETISSEFFVQGNFKRTQFSREHWNWRDSEMTTSPTQASAISIELTWLLRKVSNSRKLGHSADEGWRGNWKHQVRKIYVVVIKSLIYPVGFIINTDKLSFKYMVFDCTPPSRWTMRESTAYWESTLNFKSWQYH